MSLARNRGNIYDLSGATPSPPGRKSQKSSDPHVSVVRTPCYEMSRNQILSKCTNLDIYYKYFDVDYIWGEALSSGGQSNLHPSLIVFNLNKIFANQGSPNRPQVRRHSRDFVKISMWGAAPSSRRQISEIWWFSNTYGPDPLSTEFQVTKSCPNEAFSIHTPCFFVHVYSYLPTKAHQTGRKCRPAPAIPSKTLDFDENRDFRNKMV